MASPPLSPTFGHPPRPMSAMIRPPRSSSRMSTGSRPGGSRASDEESGKTSVKVAVRVRPPLRPEDPGFELIPQRFQRSMVNVTSPTSLSVDSPQGRKIFVFDRVFSEEVQQDGIWEYLSDSVSSFVQGYNVSLMAYGQSGAGKSYTMGTSGPTEQSDTKIMGVIPRAAAALFEELNKDSPSSIQRPQSGLRQPARYSQPIGNLGQKKAEKNWTLKATYVEIYNEQLRDLLVPGGEDRGAVTIREDPKGRILLTGLHQVEIHNFEDLMNALNFGSSIRQTDATAQNAKSSRSHAVFSLNLVQKKPKTTSKEDKRMSMPIDMMTGDGAGFMTVDSKFHFVDLAGSERLKNTGAQGERAREGISINAGLASLGKVISQLSSRNAGSHVSYRDSKLTRLLQDSLGGNAITYMVACVTPAEFHLSETLNTIQYAQRARAIQSKPRIQQVSDDGDLRALVDRLKAEIAFLREQVRSANTGENSERGRKATQERGERSNEKEIELQNQLLDLQENYSALSQRHAKLISNITKAQDPDAPPSTMDSSDNAVERLKRSNSFAEAVEQVVLEYEKTIQSLESSLSTTRTSLSNVESSLLEKETKLAYVETMNHQLQNRLQKMIEREGNTETYLQDLEQKLDGHTSGEEKNAAIIAELRKEIARVRSNETNAEDYISTLEERLAEADQDLELMQREIDRLENVVERQRSLGKLDNLLHELGSLDKKAVPEDAGEHDGEETAVATTNGDHDDVASQNGAKEESINGASEEVVRSRSNTNGNTIDVEKSLAATSKTDYPPPSPAQAEFMNDKYEVLQQELFDLKVEHEATINEFDQLNASYETALREMETMRDQLDEARHNRLGLTPTTASPPASPMPRPTSFLADARVSELKGIEGQPSSSRSLSSELSLVGESPTYLEPNGLEIQLPGTNGAVSNGDIDDTEPEVLASEVSKLKEEQEEKEHKIKELEAERERLLAEHQQTLELVADLQNDVEKARSNSGAITPQNHRFSLRRKSSQNLIVLDRAQRSFEGLRKLVMPLLEGEPDMIETFENNLESAMHELQARSERIQELEKDVDVLKIEIEKKNSMIAGLTREREISTKASSPVDISVVAALDQRIAESTAQYEFLKQKLVEQENVLTMEIDALRAKLEASVNDAQETVKELLETKNELSEQVILNAEQIKKIAALEQDLSNAESRHKEAIESLKTSEQTLLQTIESLQTSLASGASTQEAAVKEATEKHAEIEAEREAQQKLIAQLQATVVEHNTTVNDHMTKIALLEQLISAAKDESASWRQSGFDQADDALNQINAQQERIEAMEKDLEEAVAESDKHKSELETLRTSYEDALQQLAQFTSKEAEALAAIKAAEERAAAELAEANQKFEEALNQTQSELEKTRATVKEQVERLERLESSLQETTTVIEKLEEAKQNAEAQASAQFDRAAALEKDLEERQASIAKHQDTLRELQQLYDEGQEQIDRLTKKEQKTSTLTEELEQQLAYTFDQNESTSKKLADVTAELEQIRQERKVLTEENESKVAESRRVQDQLNDEIASLKTKLSEVQLELSGYKDGRAQRSNSTSSNSNNNNVLRKTSSTTSLPSPPPAIPLPPLPNTLPSLPGTASSPTSGTPGGNASRRPSKDYVVAHMEDQEARIKTLEKQLIAEKALTQTLEEALTECERSMNRLTSDRDSLQQKAAQVQAELDRTRNESQSSRYSMQAVEDERLARIKAEQAKEQLEMRMQALAKKQKRSFACF